MTSSWVDGTAVTFRVPDPGHRLAGVRLSQDVRIPGDRLDFHRDGEGWTLVIARPPVTRMEYLLEFRYPDGGSETITDPGNPRQVPGAFGPKSVLEFPSYRTPGWLTATAGPGRGRTFEVPSGSPSRSQSGSPSRPPSGSPGGSLDGPVAVRTWAPADAPDDEVLPLLIAHDGPEYDALASLTGYLAAGVAGGWLPRLRAALLSPGPRDRWYSANARYARVLAHAVIPALAGRLATSVRVGMGTSLGALAMLHAHCRYPDAFDGLFLQSGSFFCPRFDDHEKWFPYYPRVVRFVAGVRLVDQALRARGYQAVLHEVPDMHNYTAWRDAFDPYLTGLLGQVCG